MKPAQTDTAPTQAHAASQVLSVDAMGGDMGPATVVAGLSKFLAKTPEAKAIIHGPEAELKPLLSKHSIADRVTIHDASEVVEMTDKPKVAFRKGDTTSMWSSIEAVRSGHAAVCVSCGNTGALMLMSTIRLRKTDGVNRPAIACLWPSRNPSGFNVMLDAGADISADQDDLLTYALMGASYARNGLDIMRPRVGLLNVGTEDHKGRAELKVANELIANAADSGDFEYIGFIEGGDLPSAKIDVVVTDGFTGNVALKTGEGTASLISELLRSALLRNPLSILGALFARGSLNRLRKRIDPRRVNGGVFLGLNQTVIKSHGSADATGVAAALHLAYRLAQNGFSDKLAARVASAAALAQDAVQENETGSLNPSTGK